LKPWRALGSFVAVLVAAAISIAGALAADQAEQQKMYSKFIHHMHDKEYEQAVNSHTRGQKQGTDGQGPHSKTGTVVQPIRGFSAPVVRLVDARLDKDAKAGDAEAQIALGIRALKSDNFAVGVAWLDKAADQGHKVAIFVLGQ